MTKFTASIPLEWRLSASREFLEVADAMARGAISFARKSARIMDPDPKVHQRVIGTMRAYTQSTMPCGDEMYRIEAILTGTPEDQCRGAAETVREERLKRRREREEHWMLMSQARSPVGQRAPEPRSHKAAKPRNGNVIAGPWAS